MGEDGWWQQGRAPKVAVVGVDFPYFFIKTELWIVGVVDGGQRSKTISNQESLHM